MAGNNKFLYQKYKGTKWSIAIIDSWGRNDLTQELGPYTHHQLQKMHTVIPSRIRSSCLAEGCFVKLMRGRANLYQ